MAAILTNLYRTIAAGFGLALVLLVVVLIVGKVDLGLAFGGRPAWSYIFIWLHVLSGIMWLGHLYYFNFTQMIAMPKIPAEQKAAVTKFIVPEALWWFRWAAMSTLVTGLIVAWLRGFLGQALTLGISSGVLSGAAAMLIGVGMWLAAIMWFNVWFIIWPSQKRALNIANAYPNSPQPVKDRAARIAMLVSRANTMLSVPMLLAMTGGGLGYGNTGF